MKFTIERSHLISLQQVSGALGVGQRFQFRNLLIKVEDNVLSMTAIRI